VNVWLWVAGYFLVSAVVGSLVGRWLRHSGLHGTDIIIDPDTITAAPADTPITTPEAFRQ
jgi:hypothetical protein